MELEKFFLIVLWRPADHPDLSPDEIAVLQAAHLGHYDDLRRQGLVALNGPIREGSDDSLRGLAFFRTRTAAEALELALADPMARAQWLRPEVMEFWTQPGATTAPGLPITL